MAQRWRRQGKVWLAGIMCVLTLGDSAAQPASRPHQGTTAGNVLTGSYERNFHGQFSGSLEIQKLPGSRIKFEIVALEGLNLPGGPRDTEAVGTLPVQHGTAIYHSDEQGVTLIFRFEGHKIYVTEEQTNFGGAFAGGTYIRTSKKPDFNPAIEGEMKD